MPPRPPPPPEILHEIHSATGDKVPSSYIVILNDGVDKDNFIQTLQRTATSAFKLVQSYTVINGFSGIFTDTALDFVQKAHDVRHIEEVYIFGLHL